MRHVTFYNLDSGVLNGVSLLVSDDSAVAANVKLYPNHRAIDHPRGGRLDHRSQRIDIASGAVVPYTAPTLEVEQLKPAACACPKHAQGN